MANVGYGSMNGPKGTSALSPFNSQLRTLIGAARRSHSCQDLPWSLPYACKSDVALPQSCQQDVPRSHFCSGSGDAVGRHLTQTFNFAVCSHRVPARDCARDIAKTGDGTP